MGPEVQKKKKGVNHQQLSWDTKLHEKSHLQSNNRISEEAA